MVIWEDIIIIVELLVDMGLKLISNGFGLDLVVVKCLECDYIGEIDVFYELGVYIYGLCFLLFFMG